MNILRLFHTVRYLKPVQIYGRLWFKLYRPGLDLSLPSETRPIKGKKELHSRLIKKWVQENPPGEGNGWEPYPTSLRIVNWIKWGLEGNCLSDEALHSLAVQTRYLLKKLEYHLLGNHLFANAKALIFAGLFFCGKEAENWMSKGVGPIHWREWLLCDNFLEIKDHVTGNCPEVKVFYHLYPGAAVDLQKKKICLDDIDISFRTDAEVILQDTFFYPEFGKSIPNKCLVLKPVKDKCDIKFIY